MICLETTPPSNTILGPLFQFYFFNIVPLIGRLISQHGEAYSYLPHSTVDFPEPEALKRVMEAAGLRHVFYREYMLGVVAIHVGTK
ncbi:MAG: class I SAM-dependent methyltransferase [Caldilineaceae bacterium]